MAQRLPAGSARLNAAVASRPPANPVPITAIVLTRDEAARIAPCLAALAWADDLLVIDSFSEDATARGAASLGARVLQRAWTNFADQRNFALDRAATEWVFFVDADETVPPELAAEIRRRAGREPSVGYWIPRRNRILGKWLRGAGWYPDLQLRLFKRSAGRYAGDRPVHEVVRLDGPAGQLESELLHEGAPNVRTLRRKQARYVAAEARGRLLRGEKARLRTLGLQPLREFFRRLVALGGYRDGLTGVTLSALMAEHELMVCRRMRRLQKGGGEWT